MPKRCAAEQHTFVETPPDTTGKTVTHCSTCGAMPFDWGVCSAGGTHDLHEAPEFHQLHPPKKWVRCAKCGEEAEWPPPAVTAKIHPTLNTVTSHYHTLREAAGLKRRPRPDHGKAYREELRAHRAKAAAAAAKATKAAPKK